MKLVTDEEEINKIIDQNKRLKFIEINILNTPWAKDKEGKRDEKNLALFIELKNNGHAFYWLISEAEMFTLLKELSEIALYNRNNDNTGIKWNETKKLESWM